MARPEKNTVDYFPFICSEGKKMFYLEETYGNDGFATFMKILRELANTEYHYLDLSKNTTKMFLSAKCKVSKETLENIINDLVELGKFDQELWEEFEVIWCQDFINSIQDAYKKRSNECIKKEELRTLIKGLRNPKQLKCKTEGVVKPQTILEYTREKKSKEEREENPRALEFLKTEFQERFQTDFQMKYGRQIQDKKKFAEDFNDTVDLEDLEYTAKKLFPRLAKYARNWIQNQEKYAPTSENNPTSNIPIG